MKILITNNHLVKLGGTETWVITMVKELAKKHEVYVYAREHGFVSDLLRDYITNNPPYCDLALINHRSCLNFKSRTKIFTSHGLFHELEKPLEGADLYVAVSEEIANKYSINKIIRNPIDTELFKPYTKISPKPKKALALVSENALQVVKGACAALNIDLIEPSRYNYNTYDLINQADLVFSLGRGALEAMSCARAVIIYDERDYTRGADGYFENEKIKECNYSGRFFKKQLDVNSLIREIKKYKMLDGEKNRKYIIENHDVRKITDQYLELFYNFLTVESYELSTSKVIDKNGNNKLGVLKKDTGNCQPLVSIIILLCENSSNFRAAINSALNQIYDRIEVIIVSDNEKKSQEITAEYGTKLRIVSNGDDDLAKSYNVGFSESNGEIILFLDSEDALIPSALKRIVKFFNTPEVTKIHWTLWEIDEKGKKTGKIFPQFLPKGDLRESVIQMGPLNYNYPPISGNAWSRILLEKIFPVSESINSIGTDIYLLETAPLLSILQKEIEPLAFYRCRKQPSKLEGIEKKLRMNYYVKTNIRQFSVNSGKE